ncbi:GyrI-like domain-containing protein [Spirosoma validum]|uniref:GyrI-like domain-containing protein n=1 Tax=Spirosoma validum TaxID=2771355 RepID=A0A927AYE4_9BACT|nr:GyrI-like domain-containing protein [Spirosoma validum]MBD2752053.1 GyrI-like domain-containing protein [Spirosoma validum]
MTTQLSIPENALSVKETQPFTALTFTTRTTLLTLSQYVPSVAQHLYQEASRLNLHAAGPIQWIYTGANSDETNEFQLEIVLPINQPGEPTEEFSYNIFPAFRCATYVYTGPWSDFGEVYDALFAQLYRKGYQSDGHVREIYSVVDHANPANCVTEIQIGLV